MCFFSSLESASKQSIFFNVLLVKQIKHVTCTKAETNSELTNKAHLGLMWTWIKSHRPAWNNYTNRMPRKPLFTWFR